MASRRKRVRYTFDIHFSAEAEKDAFVLVAEKAFLPWTTWG